MAGFITQDPFQWSLESLVLPGNLCLLVTALLRATRLHARSKQPYYLILMCLATLRLMDITINTYSTLLPIPTPHYMTQLVVEYFAGTGFTALNTGRLYRLSYLWAPTVVRTLMVLACVSCLIYTSTTIAMLYLYATGQMETDPATYYYANVGYSAWTIFDSLLNAVISLTFVWHLRSNESIKVNSQQRQKGYPATGAIVLRQGLMPLLTEIQFILASECAFVIATAVQQVVEPSWDYMWSCYFLAEAYRLHAFVEFLYRLQRIMRDKNIRPTQPPPSSSMSILQSGSVLGSTPAAGAAAGQAHHERQRAGHSGKAALLVRSQFVSSLGAESRLVSTFSPSTSNSYSVVPASPSPLVGPLVATSSSK